MSNYATKEEALQSSLEVWEYLASNPDVCDKDKAYYALSKKLDLWDCAACEFSQMGVSSFNCGSDCRNCILWTSVMPFACEEEGSPYLKWLTSNSVAERKLGAEEMVALIKSKMGG